MGTARAPLGRGLDLFFAAVLGVSGWLEGECSAAGMTAGVTLSTCSWRGSTTDKGGGLARLPPLLLLLGLSGFEHGACGARCSDPF